MGTCVCVRACMCVRVRATLPFTAVSRLSRTILLMHGANLGGKADYPDFLLPYRLIFQVTIAVLTDDVVAASSTCGEVVER